MASQADGLKWTWGSNLEPTFGVVSSSHFERLIRSMDHLNNNFYYIKIFIYKNNLIRSLLY